MTPFNKSFRALITAATLITASLSLSACATSSDPAATETPDATLKATEVCIINESETPIEVVWKSANMRSDGDKKGKYAITKSNSGKVCGLGSADKADDFDLVITAGNTLLVATNETIGYPTTMLWFFDESGLNICKSKSSHFHAYHMNERTEYGCGATDVTIERLSDTDYKNFLVTFKSAEPYTPPSFRPDFEFPPGIL